MAVTVPDIDLANGVIRVSRSYDLKAGITVAPKSQAGARTVPVAGILRDVLDEHLLGLGRREGLVFGRSATRPFCHTAIAKRARRAWEAAGLDFGQV